MLIIHYQVSCIVGQEESAYIDNIGVAQHGECFGFLVEQLATIMKGISLGFSADLDLSQFVAYSKFFWEILLDHHMIQVIFILRQVNQAESTATDQFNNRVTVDNGSGC